MISIHPELARQVLQVLPGPVAVLNSASVIIWVNPEFAALASRDAQDCLGLTIDDLDLPLRLTLGAEARRLTAPGFTGSVLMFSLGEPGLSGVAGAGVLSREAALLRLDAEISRSRRYANPLSCLFAQVPAVPSVYGTLERMLRDQLRWVDVLARWSDTELLVLLPETHARATSALCRKLAAQAQPLLDPTPVNWGASTWRRGDDAVLFVTRALARERGQGWPLKLRARR
jgi:hypothetical protein